MTTACPNCDHAMQHVTTTNRVFWCPRCGTLKEMDEVCTPGLIDRVIAFCETLDDKEPEDREIIATMKRLGIHESITLPGQT